MNTNFLQNIEFEVSIKRLPYVEFYTQKISLPSISTSPVEQANPMNKLFHSADKVEYSNLELSFIIDEDLYNYFELFKWLHDLAFPQENHQFKNINESEEGLYSDITLLLKNSNKRTNTLVSFTNCFPIQLSEIQLDTTQQDIQYPEASATFQYDYFGIIQK